MDFAKGLLSKYGWEEGKGLGKHETGITKAIKPKLKFDNAGIGHDSAETFTHYWWEHAFNDAANNITVCQMDDGISLKTAEEFDMSTRKVSSKKRKNLIFNNFLKSATTLTKEGIVVTNQDACEETGAESSEEVVDLKGPQMTDEQLFAACGGRTAHKGARHGLGLNGKLARVEEQERRALAMISADPEVEIVPSDKGQKKKKKSKNTDKKDLARDETGVIDNVSEGHGNHESKVRLEGPQEISTTLDSRREKRKRRKELAATSSDSEMASPLEASEMTNNTTKKHKKKKSVVDNEDLQVDGTILINTSENQKKNKRLTSTSLDSEIAAPLETSETKKGAKKRERNKSVPGTQDLQENASEKRKKRTATASDLETSEESTTEKRKKKKKRKDVETQSKQPDPLVLDGNNENSINRDAGNNVKKAKKSKRKHL